MGGVCSGARREEEEEKEQKPGGDDAATKRDAVPPATAAAAAAVVVGEARGHGRPLPRRPPVPLRLLPAAQLGTMDSSSARATRSGRGAGPTSRCARRARPSATTALRASTPCGGSTPTGGARSPARRGAPLPDGTRITRDVTRGNLASLTLSVASGHELYLATGATAGCATGRRPGSRHRRGAQRPGDLLGVLGTRAAVERAEASVVTHEEVTRTPFRFIICAAWGESGGSGPGFRSRDSSAANSSVPYLWRGGRAVASTASQGAPPGARPCQ